MSSAAHSSLTDEPANLAARYSLAAQFHLRILLHLKPQSASEFRQHFHIARCFVAETEIKALMYLARVKFLLQDSFGKILGRHQRQIAPERKQQNRIDPCSFQPTDLLRSRCEQFESS